MPFKHPEYLVETEWLAAHLNDPHLRILDCTVFLHADKTRGYRVESGYQKWQEGHIPGSGFADLTKELSDPHGRFMFTMPSAERFAGRARTAGRAHRHRTPCLPVREPRRR